MRYPETDSLFFYQKHTAFRNLVKTENKNKWRIVEDMAFAVSTGRLKQFLEEEEYDKRISTDC